MQSGLGQGARAGCKDAIGARRSRSCGSKPIRRRAWACRCSSRACEPIATSRGWRPEVFALPGAARRGAQDAHRRRARRVPGDRRLQRRQRRARAARRRAAPAQRRLRVRRLRAEPDGADARAEAAVLQGRAGHAAREDSGRRVRRVHRSAILEDRHQAGSRAWAPRSSIWPATCRTTCSVWRTRAGTRCAGRRQAARSARRSAPDAAPAARRAADDVRGGLAAADAGAARACCARSCWRRDASCCRPTCATVIGSAARRRVQAALRRSLAKISSPAKRDRYVVVDSLMREWVARRTF